MLSSLVEPSSLFSIGIEDSQQSLTGACLPSKNPNIQLINIFPKEILDIVFTDIHLLIPPYADINHPTSEELYFNTIYDRKYKEESFNIAKHLFSFYEKNKPKFESIDNVYLRLSTFVFLANYIYYIAIGYNEKKDLSFSTISLGEIVSKLSKEELSKYFFDCLSEIRTFPLAYSFLLTEEEKERYFYLETKQFIIPHYQLKLPTNFLSEFEQCSKYATVKVCENPIEPHFHAHSLDCGRPWCPTCGTSLSSSHMRDIKRIAKQGTFITDSTGYFVITTPFELRKHFLLTQHLDNVSEFIKRKIKRDFGNIHCTAVWHWTGDDPTVYHPHLNIIMKDSEYIAPEQLEKFKSEVADWFQQNYDLKPTETNPNCKVNIHYDYFTTKKLSLNDYNNKLFHLLKYVTRPTLKVITDNNWFFAAELYKFTNVRHFGRILTEAEKLSSELAYEDYMDSLPKKDTYENYYASNYHNDICPICGYKMHLLGVYEMQKLRIYSYIGKKFYIVEDPQYLIKDRALYNIKKPNGIWTPIMDINILNDLLFDNDIDLDKEPIIDNSQPVEYVDSSILAIMDSPITEEMIKNNFI